MFAFVLAAVLAQTSPAPAPETTPTAAQSPDTIGFPRGPRRMPMDVPSLGPDDVLIRNSGSTNATGYAVVIHKDGTAEYRGERKTLGAAQVKWLYAKLDEATPFAGLGGGRCMKSASFGSFTTIVYRGESTPDLSCPGSDRSRELMRTVGVILDEIGVSTRRTPGMMRL